MEDVHKVNSQTSAQSNETEIKKQDLPPQRHAGQVGYGPNYNPDAVATVSDIHSKLLMLKVSQTIQEKITGLKEELKGKAKHNPELVKHGHEIRSGENKRKKITGEVKFIYYPISIQSSSHAGAQDKPNLFQSAKDSDKSPGSSSPSRDTSTPNKDERNGKTPKDGAATTVAPEGTKDVDIQKGGESVEGGKSK